MYFLIGLTVVIFGSQGLHWLLSAMGIKFWGIIICSMIFGLIVADLTNYFRNKGTKK